MDERAKDVERHVHEQIAIAKKRLKEKFGALREEERRQLIKAAVSRNTYTKCGFRKF